MVIVTVNGVNCSCIHMKILWEPFSFLSTPFVCLTTRSKSHRYVIAIAVFALLFAQCLCHDLTTDKPNDNVNATQKKWLNDNEHAVVPVAIDARVAISKRQSPTKISNSSSSSRMSSRSYGSTDIPTFSRNYYEKSTLSTLYGGGLTTISPTSTKLVITQRKHHTNPPNNVLILIQTKKNIELNLVRDQFQQFTDMFGVKLQNITIDFDAVDGKWACSIFCFIYL